MKKIFFIVAVGLFFGGCMDDDEPKPNELESTVSTVAQACEIEKNAKACHELGMAHYEGKSVKQDYEKAVQFYVKACGLKDLQSCKTLALMYAQGTKIEQNKNLAKQYYSISCEYGSKYSCTMYKKMKSEKIK